MSKKKFETLEEALAHIEVQDGLLVIANKNLETAGADLEAALGTVSELSTKVSLMETHKGENVNVVKVGKTHYTLLGNRFFVNGEELDAAALMQNQAELERMVKIKSGSLVEVEASN